MLDTFDDDSIPDYHVDPELVKLSLQWDDLSFIKINVQTDRDKAVIQYEKEYAEDIGGTRTCQQSFEQWLQCKEYEKLQLYLKIFY